jgi:hypothetical protein
MSLVMPVIFPFCLSYWSERTGMISPFLAWQIMDLSNRGLFHFRVVIFVVRVWHQNKS